MAGHGLSGAALPPPRAQINTNVYVTGLPLDVTADEVCTVFTKCGVIKVCACVCGGGSGGFVMHAAHC